MELEHTFTVPVGIDDAWQVLLDIERMAPCMPGAMLESIDGDDFTGAVKVKIGPINLTYKGKATFVEKDATNHHAVIDARGKDARGNGTANARISASLSEQDGTTTVDVLTDLDITGKPAQFGRGVMVDVGNRLIGQFAERLAQTISQGHPDGATEPLPSADSERPIETKPMPRSLHDVEAIDLMQHAGPAIAKRAAPVLVVLVLSALIFMRRRRARQA